MGEFTNSLTERLAVHELALFDPSLAVDRKALVNWKSTGSYKSNSDLTRLELFLVSRASALGSGGTGKVECLARQLDSGTQNTSSKTYLLSCWAAEMAAENRTNISLYINSLPSSPRWIVSNYEKGEL